MEDLDRLRKIVDRRTLVTLGRTSHRTRTYDSEVRSDASAWDTLRLPVKAGACQSIQQADGSFGLISGLSDFWGPGTV